MSLSLLLLSRAAEPPPPDFFLFFDAVEPLLTLAAAELGPSFPDLLLLELLVGPLCEDVGVGAWEGVVCAEDGAGESYSFKIVSFSLDT